MRHNINSDEIKEVIEKSLNLLKIEDKLKTQEMVLARQLYCYFAKKYTHDKLVAIGFRINRDHSTVVHSINKTEALLKCGDAITTTAFEKCLDEIENKLYRKEIDVRNLIIHHQNKIKKLKKWL